MPTKTIFVVSQDTRTGRNDAMTGTPSLHYEVTIQTPEAYAKAVRNRRFFRIAECGLVLVALALPSPAERLLSKLLPCRSNRHGRSLAA